jgi:hypothetical protein
VTGLARAGRHAPGSDRPAAPGMPVGGAGLLYCTPEARTHPINRKAATRSTRSR